MVDGSIDRNAEGEYERLDEDAFGCHETTIHLLNAVQKKLRLSIRMLSRSFCLIHGRLIQAKLSSATITICSSFLLYLVPPSGITKKHLISNKPNAPLWHVQKSINLAMRYKKRWDTTTSWPPSPLDIDDGRFKGRVMVSTPRTTQYGLFRKESIQSCLGQSHGNMLGLELQINVQSRT